ncbi:MAG: ribokinase [Planctomycetes bacterium GWF2_41_51]|nr:MAG: ribokinase [Planctomycetes bacterium GWF2_41_51]HBG27973.1 ribokinase [Phycisphaerales bacterium]
MAKIITVGSVNMDLVLHSKRMPVPGETIKADNFYTNPGGKGANQAVAIAKLGGKSIFLARTGDDGYGSELASALKKYGVDTSCVKTTKDCCSGIAVITVAADGENSITIAGGANDRLSPQDVDDIEDNIASADAVMMQLEVPIDTIKRAIQLAKKHNKLTILDPTPVPADGIPDDLFRVDIFSPNKSETEMITGIPVKTDNDIKKSCDFIFSKGAKQIVMKLGSEGALIASASGNLKHIPAFKVKPIDTTAAGDCFTAAMTLSFIETGSIEQAVQFACAAGALTVTAKGAQQSIPNRKDVEEFLKKQ